ncbi:nicotinate-nucleotide adenylyltransferase [Lentibacillus saliphilus]|uniref:nicotinate-nucleotide adenylyltransferase n=1 Tax=Lentibacillus saliphilus TaxID=2737028 RepID=UPI001C2F1C13|nr:nicotinate-nucleotide adenylyltransferase [Lentibacillus saliphilus]
MKHIGILGGSFDPPHTGHLLIAEHVRDALELDEVWFIPTFVSPHKDTLQTSPNERLEMLDRAINENDQFKLSTVEMERQGTSYTVDTMTLLNERHSDTTFYFIIGADMVAYLPHWHDINKLTQLVTFVGVKRRGYELQTDYPIVQVDIPMIDISSTDIRQRIKAGKTIKYIVPHAVETYINERRLYE